MFIVVFSEYNSYGEYDDEGEKAYWAILSFCFAMLTAVSWIVRYLGKSRYIESLDQMIGGLKLSGGSFSFITEQSDQIKTFASLELIKLINKGVIEKVEEMEKGEQK